MHEFYLDVMRKSASRLEPDYARRLIDLDVAPGVSADGSVASHPVTARLERTDPEHEGQVETVRARYVVGCDGARSTVRKSLGRELRGDSANHAWGVMDVLAVTDFPDIRLKALIQSADEGNIVLIPREGGYLVRLYIELDKLNEGERVSSRNITSGHLVAAAQRIFRPYTLDVKEVAWWSVYEIGQRLCDRFDDVPEHEAGGRLPHVFIAGDACHTHSPKAGLGMNVSMQDSLNLGWKLASVLRGRARPEVLHSYSAERQAIASELIDFDREWARILSARPKAAADEGSEGVDPAETQDYFVRHGRYTAGTATRYRPSMITAEPVHQHLAKGFVIGMRFHSSPVIRLADGKPVHLGHTIEADGRWRIFAFAGAGDPAGSGSGIGSLCSFLPSRRSRPSGDTRRRAKTSTRLSMCGRYSSRRTATLPSSAMPSFLLPPERPVRASRLRKDVLRRAAERRYLQQARHRAGARAACSSCGRTSMSRMSCHSTRHSELAAFFDRFMIRAG